LGPLPGDLQVFALAESLDVFGDDFLNLLQVFSLVASARSVSVWAGLQGALAPAEADDAIGFGLGCLHLGRRLRVATVVRRRPVAQAVDLPGVFAELGEVPARVFGLDVGFGGWHRGPFQSCVAWGDGVCVLGVAVVDQHEIGHEAAAA